MKLGTKIVLFVVAWVGIYALGFLYYQSLSAGDTAVAFEQENDPSGVGAAPYSPGPDLSALSLQEQWQVLCAARSDEPPSEATVGVVVALDGRAGEREEVLRLVQSVQSAGGVRHIAVVDDHTHTHASDWPEWAALRAAGPAAVTVSPNVMRRGRAAALAAGASVLLPEVDVLIFLDAGVTVAADWLRPLMGTLHKHPHAVVYPGIDVEGSPQHSGNVVAAFDWALSPRWEEVTGGRARLGFDHTEASYYQVAPSPAAPPEAFALRAHYYSEIGGLALTDSFSAGGIDVVELSLRVWLCGGSVLRAPCSRIAVRYTPPNQPLDGGGVSRGRVDIAAMSTAELWLGRDFQEYTYQARFADRLPYRVESDRNARRPPHLVAASAIGEDSCASFEWYLQAVYPGLAVDAPDVRHKFDAHVHSPYVERALAPLLEQYAKQGRADTDDSEVARLTQMGEAERAVVKQAHREYMSSMQKHDNGKVDRLAKHEDEVKHNLLCEDYPLGDCETKAKNGDCLAHQPATIFQCPASCGLCTAEGQFCSDLYLGKCPLWKKEGKCESDPEFVEENCRHTCGICTRLGEQKFKEKPANNPAVAQKSPSSAALIDSGDAGVDEKRAHRLYLEGSLPDQTANACSLAGTPNGQLMDVMRIEDTDALTAAGAVKPVRLFCAIYTMEKNHKTSVRSTIDTWGKRCDGFVAYSTASDPEFNAFNIEHEGEESYNNMWQKSRAIWKHIGAHFKESYDFFLLGGDDMWFIVENLRAYLGSAEITAARAEGRGLYIGRRFFPPGQPVFNSGGAGAILDPVALQVLTTHVDAPPCRPHQVGFWEDVNVAFCLAETGKILPYDTRDEFGRERFHPFTPGQHIGYRVPPKNPDWYAKYNPELKVGVECCSETSISFHYAKEDIMRRLHGYMYHCDRKPRSQDRSKLKIV